MTVIKFNAKEATNVELHDAAHGGVRAAKVELAKRALKGDKHARSIAGSLVKKRKK